MENKNIVYFSKQSFQDGKITLETLRLSKERAQDLGIKRVLIPSSSGGTASAAVDVFEGSGLEVIVVSDRAGVKFGRDEYRSYGKRLLPSGEVEELLGAIGLDEEEEHESGLNWNPDLKAKLLESGLKIVIASEPFRAMIRSRVDPTFVVAETLSLFGKGVKVAAEVALAACDAGFVDSSEEVIALGGFTKGVDTALVLKACHRDEMFAGVAKGLQIREIICKPRLG